MIHTAHYSSPVGDILLAERENGLIGLWIEGQKYFFGSLKEEAAEQLTPILTQAGDWLDRYFAGGHPPIGELRLTPIGSAFCREVWKMLCEIPYGEVTTYGEIAKELAVRTGRYRIAAQAVGGAVGHNPISIIIPCHRVVGSNGSLTGYAGGITTKVKLLSHEGVDMTKFTVPKKGTAL